MDYMTKNSWYIEKGWFLYFVDTAAGIVFKAHKKYRKKCCSLIKWVKYIRGGKDEFSAQFVTKKLAGKIVAKTIKLQKDSCGTWDVTTEAHQAFSNRRVKLVPLLHHGNMQNIIRKMLVLQDRIKAEPMFHQAPDAAMLWKGCSGLVGFSPS